MIEKQTFCGFDITPRAAMWNKIDELKTKAETLQDQRNRKQGELDKAVADVKRLERLVEQYKKTNETQMSRIAQLEEENESLTTKNGELLVERNHLDAELRNLKEENKDLKCAVENKSNLLESAMGQLEAMFKPETCAREEDVYGFGQPEPECEAETAPACDAGPTAESCDAEPIQDEEQPQPKRKKSKYYRNKSGKFAKKA